VLPTPPEGLRHWHPDDAPALEAAWADPDITRWNPTPEGLSAARWIAGTEARWERRLALDLVVSPPDERTDGSRRSTGRDERTDRFARVAGEVGLAGFTTDPSRAELGVWIAAPHRRSGSATTAVRTVTAWALAPDGLALDQVWARTDPANHAAAALFARLGWDPIGTSGRKRIWSATAVLLR
jgi:[ribosomal protein S5]-alanine N-acetyltransferase